MNTIISLAKGELIGTRWNWFYYSLDSGTKGLVPGYVPDDLLDRVHLLRSRQYLWEEEDLAQELRIVALRQIRKLGAAGEELYMLFRMGRRARDLLLKWKVIGREAEAFNTFSPIGKTVRQPCEEEVQAPEAPNLSILTQPELAKPGFSKVPLGYRFALMCRCFGMGYDRFFRDILLFKSKYKQLEMARYCKGALDEYFKA